ncbi:MAG: FitA-like ribbon-helix-helix domain-containing protein [Cyanobium sp.]
MRQVPDALYHRLKSLAAAHRRSMNQEATLAPEARTDGLVPARGQARRRRVVGLER